MGLVLDAIIKEKRELNQTVNTDVSFEAFEIDRTEDGFSLQVDYNNGNGSVDMFFVPEFSVDGNSFTPDTASQVGVTDDSGTIIFDVVNTAANYFRISMTVTNGSLDVETLTFSGKRRH